MGAQATPRAAPAAQVAAWKRRAGYSNAQAAEVLGVHHRTFQRWLSGESESPKAWGDRFREGVK